MLALSHCWLHLENDGFPELRFSVLFLHTTIHWNLNYINLVFQQNTTNIGFIANRSLGVPSLTWHSFTWKLPNTACMYVQYVLYVSMYLSVHLCHSKLYVCICENILESEILYHCLGEIQCTSYFIEPVQWMEQALLGVMEGQVRYRHPINKK